MLVTPSSKARVPGDNKAHLIIPNVPSSGEEGSCVRFYYQMSGGSVVDLRLFKRTPSGEISGYSLWSHGSHQANSSWRVGQVTVDAPYVHEVGYRL